MSTLSKLRRDERGAAMITAAAAVLGALIIAVLAIDISTMMLAKTQLQNAADAAALAAARSYFLSGGNEILATNEAIQLAGLNSAVEVNGRQPVVIDASNVTFQDDTVTVVTHRWEEDNHPVGLHFLRMVDPDSDNRGEVTAQARALAGAVSGTDCFKPWSVPDKWDDENEDSIYNVGEFYDPDLTGYRVPDDVGRLITLKFRKADNSAPRQGWFFPICFPPLNTGDPLTGGNIYNQWIVDCEPYLISVGDFLMIEPGGMVGPTDHGIDDLYGLDPGASWDPATGNIINSAWETSPRLIKIAAYDPSLGYRTDNNGRGYVTISKLLLVFLEAPGEHGDIIGRFVQKTESNGSICPDCPPGFMMRTALVE